MTQLKSDDDFETIDHRTLADSGENSDGWVDAGHEHAMTTQAHDLIDLGGDAADSTRNLPPINTSQERPGSSNVRPSNNPFLNSRRNGSTSRSVSQSKEREHEAAWAEFMAAPSPTAETPNHAFDPVYTGEVADASKGKAREGDATYETSSSQTPHSATVPSSPTGHTNTQRELAVLPPPPPRNQTYTIKHVRWLDHRGGDSIRTTPILMQNLNGPCPLLSLVNALTMSTPPGKRTSLFETLRTREQVSLNLLLEAVVEELMTSRGEGQGGLPDMVELYDFLMALHTGMNVNPMFVPSDETPNLIDFEPTSPKSPVAVKSAGGFEATKEMRLYSTFAVPLVHGWLLPRAHPSYNALKRSARSHEDAENILTMEDELERKLANNGLSEDEQRTLEDISSIKYFLNSSTTQLTAFGLETIQDTMEPGKFTILFRNNHFSTLYKHPLTHHVFSLVTDMGYVKYDEIVWESLVDVNGAGAELFSGDFRVVSHNAEASTPREEQRQNDDQGWTTVDRSSQRMNRKPVRSTETGVTSTESPPDANTHEQEDADLALALQLQEEEEERHRRESAAARGPQPVPPRSAQSAQAIQQHHRRRSSQNQQVHSYGTIGRNPARPNQLVIQPTGMRQDHRTFFQDSSANSSTSQVDRDRPVRGAQSSNSPFNANARTEAPPRGRRPQAASEEATGDEPPPPPYESALEDEPYVPPENSAHHPSSPVGSPTVGSAPASASVLRSGPRPVNFDDVIARTQAPSQAHSAATAQGSVYSGGSHSRLARRSSGANAVRPPEGRRKEEKECIVM